MARPVLTTEQVQEFRQRTCDVSMRLFVEHGYEAFSLRALARELGCSHATPYRYFADKAEIFAMVRAESFGRFASFMRAQLDGVADPLARVRTLAQAYFDFAQQRPHAFRMMFELGQPEGDYAFVDEAGHDAWSVMKTVVKQAVEAGVLMGSPHELAHGFWASVHGVASLQLARKFNMGQNGEDVLGAVIESLISAHAGSKKKKKK